MAPTLFSMMFPQPGITDAFHDDDIGIPLFYLFDGSSSTLGDCKQKPRYRLMSSVTFSSQMTVHLMLAPSLKCRRAWILVSAAFKDFGLKISKKDQGYVATDFLLYPTQSPSSQYVMESLLWQLHSPTLASHLIMDSQHQ